MWERLSTNQKRRFFYENHADTFNGTAGRAQLQLNGKIHETFALVRNSVEAELHGATPAVAPIAGMPVASTCTKAKTPTVNNYYTLRTDNELDRFVSFANGIEKSVNSGNFYPNESGFGCGECPYADRCKKWR